MVKIAELSSNNDINTKNDSNKDEMITKVDDFGRVYLILWPSSSWLKFLVFMQIKPRKKYFLFFCSSRRRFSVFLPESRCNICLDAYKDYACCEG